MWLRIFVNIGAVFLVRELSAPEDKQLDAVVAMTMIIMLEITALGHTMKERLK